MSNKTISINPSLFSLNGTKTKKKREKTSTPKITPLISPNVLKNKLLKRIKEHKTKETQHLENNKRKLGGNEDIPIKTSNVEQSFSDEFTDSINYLQTLSKQKRINEEKINSDKLNQKRKEELERKTVRNYHSLNENNNSIINIDLPDELMQPVIIQESSIKEPFHLNTKNEVPYGILKGGQKPSYREWNKTQRSNIVTNPNASLVIEGGNNSSLISSRENRLNLLKQKIQNKTSALNNNDSQNLIKRTPIQNIQNMQNVNPELNAQNVKPEFNVQNVKPELNAQNVKPESNVQNVQNSGGKIIATKHITKKTIKRKYTLGRSKIKRTVSVLIKDRGTRKRVLNAQKDLKRKNINDIKLYLRDHNLIKTGTNAPTDVLRKIYESAMLSGEITNSNADTLLHNYSKEDKEL